MISDLQEVSQRTNWKRQSLIESIRHFSVKNLHRSEHFDQQPNQRLSLLCKIDPKNASTSFDEFCNNSIVRSLANSMKSRMIAGKIQHCNDYIVIRIKVFQEPTPCVHFHS